VKYSAPQKGTEPISIDEAARRMGVSEEEVIDCIRYGKLATTSQLDELCVLWPTDNETAAENKIITDVFADPARADDPKWLIPGIMWAWFGLFVVAAIWLMFSIIASATNK
jgi:hypothetical protein